MHQHYLMHLHISFEHKTFLKARFEVMLDVTIKKVHTSCLNYKAILYDMLIVYIHYDFNFFLLQCNVSLEAI